MNDIEAVRAELNTRKGQWPEICSRTGLRYWWLVKFADGRILEPGASKIDRLRADLLAFNASPLDKAA